MSLDAELDTWRREWQSEKSAVPDLAAKVRRHSRFMRIMLAADVLVTVVIGGGTIVWAVRSSETDVMVLAGATWFFLAIAWVFGTINLKGCWAPAALNASAFLDLSIRRCRHSIATSRLGAILYCSELLFCLMWIYRHKHAVSPEEFLTSPSVAVVWIFTAGFAVLLFWYQRRKQAELAYLLKLQSGARCMTSLAPDSQV